MNKIWQSIKAFFSKIFERPDAQVIQMPLPKPPPVVEKPEVIKPLPVNPTPWMDWMKARLGWNEKDNNKQLAQYWKYTNFSDGQKAQSVIGAQYAWCAMTVNAALFETGYVGNRSPAADSFIKFGNPCEIKYGAIIVLQHTSGSYHVTFFYRWVDESKRLAELLGGNQSDALIIKQHNLSGNAKGFDQVVACRWPINVPQKEIVTQPSTELSPMKPLSWEAGHPERKEWSAYLCKEVNNYLPVLMGASDISHIYAGLKNLNVSKQVNIFAEFICWLCYYESGWNPASNSVDVGNKGDVDTYSVGLMQMSVVDQPNYGFNFGYAFKDLQDPLKNMHLGLAIMSKMVKSKGLIMVPKGSGPYWAIICPGGKYQKIDQILAKVKLFGDSL